MIRQNCPYHSFWILVDLFASTIFPYLHNTVFASYFASCVFFFLFGIFIVVGAALFSDGIEESVFLILIGVFLSLFSVYKFVKTFIKINSNILRYRYIYTY